MGKNTTQLITIFILIFILLISSCSESPTPSEKNNKKHNGYTITGKTSTTIVNYVYLLDAASKKIDSAKIENQIFSLQGKVNAPSLYYIQLQNNTYKHPIVIENTSYNLLINKKETMIIGGTLNTKLTNYQYVKTLNNKEKSNLYDKFTAKDITLRFYLNKLDSLQQTEKKRFTNFIVSNENNILPSIVLREQNLSSKDIIELKSQITTSTNIDLLNNLNTLTEDLKNEEAEKKILRRKNAPLFSGVNLLGSKSSLKTVMKGKKLFLIDFWASWCPPCRKSSPQIISLYHKYHKKGFDILTVSEDRSVNAWKNGIHEDGLDNWHHIYDDYNRISSMYGVTSLPHMVLIDENGKIIKNKISLKNLEIELDKKFTP